MRRLRLVLALFGVVLAAAAFAAVATADDDDEDGFKTTQPAMLTCDACRSVTPIMSVGDSLPGGYLFEAIPDGISVIGGGGGGDDDDDEGGGDGRSDDDDDDGAEILLNHELSLVPFPAARQDPSNSVVSRLRLNGDAEVMSGRYVIPASAGYQRFCSNFLVGRQHGFSRQLLFTNEEARDIVLRQADSWHNPNIAPGLGGGVQYTETGAEQAGVVVAYDVRSGEFKSIYGMGRHNHENAVGIPGYGHPVVLSGDDTFDAPGSQLFIYEATNGSAVWNDQGKLYAFVSDTAGVNDYGDVTSGMTVDGHFIEVPRDIATGKLNGNLSARDITSLDYPDPQFPAPPVTIPDGPQWVLETWSNLNNVFQFIRVEDTAYDRRNPRTVYLADTGEPRALGDVPPRLRRAAAGTNGPYMNGRLFKLQLNKKNPLVNAKLSILPNANFDAGGYARADVPHQPDNMETTRNAIYFQEDPGAHNSSSPPTGYPAFGNATNARIWRYDLKTAALTVVAEVKQDVPGSPTTIKGTWESSGIVDASSVFGRGAFLVDIQAHTWDVAVPGGGNDPPAIPQRERGQLLLIKVRNP